MKAGPAVTKDDSEAARIGADIRALRRGKGVALATLAREVGRSIGWLSQVERGLASPSVSDLQRLAAALERPMSFFFRHAPAPAQERGLVVRAAHAARIGDAGSGLVEELLSPHLSGAFEMLRCTFYAGAEATIVPRSTEEGVVVLSGALVVVVRGREHRLGPGDAMQLQGGLEGWRCPGPDPCVALWVVAPPNY